LISTPSYAQSSNKLVAKIATDVGKSLVRSGKMPQAICVVPPGDEAALRLFHHIWTGEQAVRLIGVGVSGLGAPPRQLSLWDAPSAPTPEQLARQQRVKAALAAIQARFGAGAVRRGSELGEP
jgi:impB/mucB/samB family C-terminal domain